LPQEIILDGLEITNGVVLLKRMTHDFPKYVNENNDRYWRNSEGEEALELKKTG